MQLLKKISIIIFLIVFFPIFSEAGWFSKPKNFEDCVLEKMKGQDKSMRSYAIRACRKLFPEEKEIDVFLRHDIEITWSSDASSISLEIKKNDSEYEISKCIASFSFKECESITKEETVDETSNQWVEGINKIFEDVQNYPLKKTFLFKKGENSSHIKIDKADQYKCMKQLSLWGFLKN